MFYFWILLQFFSLYYSQDNIHFISSVHPEFVHEIENSFHAYMSQLQHTNSMKRAKQSIPCGHFNAHFSDIPYDFQYPICFALKEVISPIFDTEKIKDRTTITFQFLKDEASILGYGLPQCQCYTTSGLLKQKLYFDFLYGKDKCACDFEDIIYIHEDENWYKGIDGKLDKKQNDLVSLIVHEMGHMFGFTNVFEKSEKEIKFTENSYFQDKIYTFDTQTLLSEVCTTNYTETCYKYIKENDFEIHFHKTIFPLYKEKTLNARTSLIHFEEIITKTCDSLHVPFCNNIFKHSLRKGRAIHRLGAPLMAYLEDYGFPIRDCRNYTDVSTCVLDGRCDWCNSGQFCNDITMIDLIWKNKCKGNDFTHPYSASLTSSSFFPSSIFH